MIINIKREIIPGKVIKKDSEGGDTRAGLACELDVNKQQECRPAIGEISELKRWLGRMKSQKIDGLEQQLKNFGLGLARNRKVCV